MKQIIVLFIVAIISGCDGTMDVIATKIADEAAPKAELNII